MIPSTEHVMKKRHHNRRRLRFMAMTLAVVATIFLSWGAFAAGFAREWDRSEWQPYAMIAAGLVVPALLLWGFDGFLARALVPLPGNRCPRCNYELILLERSVCPECGLPVPAVFLRPPTSSST